VRRGSQANSRNSRHVLNAIANPVVPLSKNDLKGRPSAGGHPAANQESLDVVLPDKIAVCCGQILCNRFCNAEMESTSNDLCDVLRILLPLLL